VTSGERPGGERPLRALVEPVTAVGAATTCGEIDKSFRNRWTFSSIIVLPPEPGGRPGLVSRSRFLAMMAGHRGYGRLQWEGRPIGELATWDPPTVRDTATLAEAAARLGDSPEGYGDLVVVDERGAPVGIVRAVRVMQALADRAVQRAATDDLTGVASRSHLVGDLAERLTAIGSRDTGAVVVAYLDLDRLKAVNDSLGHTWGDALLRSVVTRVSRRLQPSDLVGRLGGDEFAVVRSLPPSDLPDADRLAVTLGEALREAVAATDAHLPSTVHSRASVGVAVATSSDTSADALLHAADHAMYAAKAAGGDCVCLAGTAVPPSSWALVHRLEVVYQPIVDMKTDRLVAVEALLRQRNADGGLDGPEVPLAEAAHAGMSLDLDRWVLDRACRDMLAWRTRHGDAAPAAVHVNLAADSLRHPGLVSAVLDTIDATGLPRECVRLELSEHAGAPDLTNALDRLEAIARGGVRLALDDLGESFETLRILHRLPIDALKIDRSVVVGAGRRAVVDTAVLSLLVDLGRDLDLELVGEGVERPADEATLLSAGVHLAQGFRYSHPVPAGDIDGLVAPPVVAPPVEQPA
jgi:diguanylate cyclase (GGDEF)-like protein